MFNVYNGILSSTLSKQNMQGDQGTIIGGGESEILPLANKMILNITKNVKELFLTRK